MQPLKSSLQLRRYKSVGSTRPSLSPSARGGDCGKSPIHVLTRLGRTDVNVVEGSALLSIQKHRKDFDVGVGAPLPPRCRPIPDGRLSVPCAVHPRASSVVYANPKFTAA